MKKFFQHNFNELHIYCRLRSLGLSHKTSKQIASLCGAFTSYLIY